MADIFEFPSGKKRTESTLRGQDESHERTPESFSRAPLTDAERSDFLMNMYGWSLVSFSVAPAQTSPTADEASRIQERLARCTDAQIVRIMNASTEADWVSRFVFYTALQNEIVRRKLVVRSDDA